MNPTEAQLRERYKDWHTDGLIDLLAQGGLTEAAENALNAELAMRQIPTENIKVEVARAAVTVNAQRERDERIAPVSNRLLAFVVDVVAALLATIVFFVVCANYGPTEYGARYVMIGFCVLPAYLLFRDGIKGQGLGKRVMRLRVIDINSNKPAGIWQSLARNLFLPGVTGVIGIAYLASEDRRHPGDRLARTMVVRADK